MPVSVNRNALLQELDNAETWAGLSKVTDAHVAKKLLPFLKKGKVDVDADVIVYGSDELGGDYEYNEYGLTDEQKRALTSSPFHVQRFKLQHRVFTEVVGDEIMDQSLSPEMRKKVTERKIGNLGIKLFARMWKEFVEKLTKYDETSGKVEYPKLNYYYGEGEVPEPVKKGSSIKAVNPADFKKKVGEFEDSLQTSVYSPNQIIKFNLMDKNATEDDVARIFTNLISCCMESEVTIKEGGKDVVKRNTRAGSEAYCELGDILLFVNWSVLPKVEIILKSPIVGYYLAKEVAKIIPVEMKDPRFQIVAVSRNTIFYAHGIKAIKKKEEEDTLKIKIHKHDKYHIDFSSRDPLVAIANV